MHSEWHLDIGKLCFIFTKILCILEKQQTINIDSYFVEGIRNKEFWHPRRASHNTANAVETGESVCALRHCLFKQISVITFTNPHSTPAGQQVLIADGLGALV